MEPDEVVVAEVDGPVEHTVVASGVGEMRVDSLDAIGLAPADAVTTAMFFFADDIRGMFAAIKSFSTRRAIVEGAIADMEALAAHQLRARLADDKISTSSFVQGLVRGLCGRIEDALGIYDELPKAQTRKMTLETIEAGILLRHFARKMRRTFCALELTGLITEDDDRHNVSVSMAVALRDAASLAKSLRRLRGSWAKAVLGSRGKQVADDLEAAVRQRVAELEAARQGVLGGTLSPLEGAAVQYGFVRREEPEGPREDADIEVSALSTEDEPS